MKAILFITSIFCMQISAKALSQDRFTLDVKEAKLARVLSLLQKNSNYRFFYNTNTVNQQLKVDLNVKEATLTEVLDKILDDGLSYKIMDSKAVIIADRKALQQQRTLRGRVVDETNLPLPGVSILVKGTNRGASSDTDGTFVIQIGSQDSLEISYLGYRKQVIPVAERDNIVIRMESSASALDEVVVVGYGSQKRSTVSGAVADVSLDKLSSRSLGGVGDALQGKSPGVTVSNEGGDPTAAPRVNVRGLGGINGESPLYVIDGVIFDGTPNINPNDIASINILKDASAAIYGARASGGVILITTKKGTSGDIKVSLDAKLGIQNAWKKIKALDAKQFADVMNTASDNAGQERIPAFDANSYPDGQITRTNWIDEVLRQAYVNEYNVNLTGGGEKSTFFTGFGYRKNEGILLNTYSQRYNATINSEHKLKPWLTFGEHLQYSNTNGNGANTSNAYYGALVAALFYPPSISVYTSTGDFSGLPIDYAGSYGDVINPVAYLKRLDSKMPTHNLMINPYLEASILPGLKFKSNFAYSRNNSITKIFTTRVPEIGRISTSNGLEQTTSSGNNLLAEQTLNYNHNWSGHNLDFLGGYTYQKIDFNATYVRATDFDNESAEYRYFQNANTIYKPEDTKTSSVLISYLARINYDYQGKYLLSILGRRDGSSLVSPQNRFANYGSISGGWLASEEDFLKGTKWLSLLKLRASYGVLGNLGSLPAYASSVPLSSTTSYLGNGSIPNYGYAETMISNPDLKWAKSRQTNIGLDFGVMNNQLTLNADVFEKTTSDMIIQKTLPSTVGAPDGQYVNAGKARDRGFELGINYSNRSDAPFQYNIGASITKVSNKLLALNDGLSTISTTQYNVRGALTPVLIRTGETLYAYNVIPTDGLFKSAEEVNRYTNANGELIQPDAQAGDIKFVDSNGDGTISDDDRRVVGSAYPSFSYGLSFNASYKNFDLNIFLQGVQGNKVFNSLKYLGLQAGLGGQHYNMWDEVLEAWSPEHPEASIPRVSFADANGNFSRTSDFFVEDGSYLRVKNVTLGYTFNNTFTKKIGLGALRLYVTANNLLTFTGYSGLDPEVGMDNYGIDVLRYPQARTFFFGLNVNF